MKVQRPMLILSGADRMPPPLARYFGRLNVAVAWLGLGLAILSSPTGLGISLCWWRDATGIPCLGCGLTRSLSCACRGLFVESWNHHPLGIAILGLFLVTVAQSLLPQRWRGRLVPLLTRHAAGWGRVYAVFIGAFVVYGTTRALSHCLARWFS